MKNRLPLIRKRNLYINGDERNRTYAIQINGEVKHRRTNLGRWGRGRINYNGDKGQLMGIPTCDWKAIRTRA